MKLEPITYMPDGSVADARCLHRKPCNIYPGAQITTEPGYLHRHKIREATDIDQAKFNLAIFQDAVDHADGGYELLDVREYQVQIGNYYKIGLELVYAIHQAGSPSPCAPHVRSSHVQSAYAR